jgi:hypothetical protein
MVQSYLQMQYSLMDQLYEKEFISFQTNIPSNVMRICLHSYANPTTKAWLLTRPSTHSFCLFLAHFLTMLHIHFGIPHPTFTHLP